MEIQIRLGKIDEDHYFLQVKVLAFADLNLNVFTRLQFLVKVLAVSQLHYTILLPTCNHFFEQLLLKVLLLLFHSGSTRNRFQVAILCEKNLQNLCRIRHTRCTPLRRTQMHIR